MRIGVLADIHGHVENLRKAIERLTREQVDRFVVLGDVICDSRNAIETVAILKDCGAVGVWGNHELGLCVDPNDAIRATYTEPVMEFFSTLTSRLELDDLLLSHTLPNQDASDPLSYYLGPRPHMDRALNDCFSHFPHRVMMVGHFHRWFAATPAGRIAWNGCEPMKLKAEARYFFVINAVMRGWAAIVDNDRDVLIPIQL
jgi:predicted phosphodiesterase